MTQSTIAIVHPTVYKFESPKIKIMKTRVNCSLLFSNMF